MMHLELAPEMQFLSYLAKTVFQRTTYKLRDSLIHDDTQFLIWSNHTHKCIVANMVTGTYVANCLYSIVRYFLSYATTNSILHINSPMLITKQDIKYFIKICLGFCVKYSMCHSRLSFPVKNRIRPRLGGLHKEGWSGMAKLKLIDTEHLCLSEPLCPKVNYFF